MNHPAAADGSRRRIAGYLLTRRLHQRHAESLALTVAHCFDLDRLTRVVVAHDPLKSADAIDGLTIGGDDHVARLQSRLPGRSVFVRKIPNEHTANVLDAGNRSILRADIVNADAERGNPNAAVGNELIHHSLGESDWNREAVTRIVAGRAGDRAVDTDHFTLRVDQRSARVARVDRRIGLNHVADRVLVRSVRIHQLGETPYFGADDSSSHSVLEAERISDRQHPLTDA